MKVIFLDIDGVLNSHRSCTALGGYPWPGTCAHERDWHKFDDVAVGLLRRACHETGAVCVLSSTWRAGMSEVTRAALSARLGVPIIGATRTEWHRGKRGEEIRDWLIEHQDVSTYAILDDDSDMLPEQMDRFVKVQHEDGLSYRQYRRLVDLLVAV